MVEFNVNLIGRRINQLQGRDCCAVAVLGGTGLTRELDRREMRDRKGSHTQAEIFTQTRTRGCLS